LRAQEGSLRPDDRLQFFHLESQYQNWGRVPSQGWQHWVRRDQDVRRSAIPSEGSGWELSCSHRVAWVAFVVY
jgi:hypothetical protein